MQLQIKRLADCPLALAAILLTLPALGIGIWLTARSGQGIFFVQERVGKDGKPFRIYKLRTMYRNTPDLPRDLLGDPHTHCIPGGYFLRKTGIDELPQLWNVLKGEMSLVGPRPLLAVEQEMHRLRAESGADRLRPGITGLAQLCGDPPPAVKANLDAIYQSCYSPVLDAAILWGTARLLWERRKHR